MQLAIGDVSFGYDRSGSGEPLILVMGLGAPRLGWLPQVAALSQRYDVVTYDNRGVGETRAPGGFTVGDMADDVLAIADAFGFETFHLAGISMGGMISQQVVLSAPEHVRSVTLMSTACGGPEAVPMSTEFTAAMLDPDPVARMRKSIELTFGRAYRQTNPEMMELIVAGAMAGVGGMSAIGSEGADAGGYFGQVMAVVNWMADGGSFDRLSTITTPTLVLHGGDDLLLPIGNGHLIEREIPGARARYWDDAGHALNMECADEVNAELIEHIESSQALV